MTKNISKIFIILIEMVFNVFNYTLKIKNTFTSKNRKPILKKKKTFVDNNQNQEDFNNGWGQFVDL